MDDPRRDALVLAEQLRPVLDPDHIASAAATLALAVRELQAAGRDVLLLSSVLAPEPISAALVAMSSPRPANRRWARPGRG